MKITSPSFRDGENIPDKYTCYGQDTSPALLIQGIPSTAKTLAILVTDPDAPSGLWTHWIAYNIPLLSVIAEGSAPGEQGINTDGARSYGGPCPPSGTHHYIFQVYALDTELRFQSPPDNAAFMEAIAGHVVEAAQLTGLSTHK